MFDRFLNTPLILTRLKRDKVKFKGRLKSMWHIPTKQNFFPFKIKSAFLRISPFAETFFWEERRGIYKACVKTRSIKDPCESKEKQEPVESTGVT